MKKISSLLALSAFVSLAGCGLGGTFYAEPFAKQSISGNDFNAHLAKAYQQRTQDAADNDVNWILAGMYAKKGMAASNGEDVQPWNPVDYYESPTMRDGVAADRTAKYDLNTKRANLVSAVAAHKNERPEACAQAQAHYDWLVDEAFQDTTVQRETRHDEEEDKIQADFNNWLTQCIGNQVQKEAPQAANQWVIYFGWDRFDLTAEARRVVNEAVAAAKNAVGSVLSVVGHADRSGSDGYNDALSQRRANAVAKSLNSQGVGNIQAEGRGEHDLAKPTKDGVREPANRRAVITIQ